MRKKEKGGEKKKEKKKRKKPNKTKSLAVHLLPEQAEEKDPLCSHPHAIWQAANQPPTPGEIKGINHKVNTE